MHIDVFLLQKKDKAQKRQQREQRLESLRSLAVHRSCRIRRPVNYTCGIYEFVWLITVF